MKVILISDVHKLGSRGDVVNVADGYARNYLIPRNLAKVATPRTIKVFEKEAHLEEKREEKRIQKAKEIMNGLSKVILNLKMKAGDDGRLFGSITTKDISEELEKLGYKIDKRTVHLLEPIKTLGSFNIEIELARGVKVNIPVVVEKE
ncbi:MAG: 50S ribosomal protein L9 [bacterium]